MEHPGGCRDRFADAGADPAERAARLERLGLFFNGCSGGATFGLPETEDGAKGRKQKRELSGIFCRMGIGIGVSPHY